MLCCSQFVTLVSRCRFAIFVSQNSASFHFYKIGGVLLWNISELLYMCVPIVIVWHPDWSLDHKHQIICLGSKNILTLKLGKPKVN